MVVSRGCACYVSVVAMRPRSAIRFYEIVIDCSDPLSLAPFWAEALGYKIQDPPGDFDSLRKLVSLT